MQHHWRRYEKLIVCGVMSIYKGRALEPLVLMLLVWQIIDKSVIERVEIIREKETTVCVDKRLGKDLSYLPICCGLRAQLEAADRINQQRLALYIHYDALYSGEAAELPSSWLRRTRICSHKLRDDVNMAVFHGCSCKRFVNLTEDRLHQKCLPAAVLLFLSPVNQRFAEKL